MKQIFPLAERNSHGLSCRGIHLTVENAFALHIIHLVHKSLNLEVAFRLLFS